MTAAQRLDRIGGHILIYEGAVLALRLVPRVPRLPAVSDLVWRLPRWGRCMAAAPVLGYLGWHLVAGPHV